MYDVSPVLLHIDGYVCFFSSFNRGSYGVCIYVMSSFHASVPDINLSESLWCSVMVCGFDTLVAGVIYRSPSSSPENDSNLLRLLAEVQKLAKSHLLRNY